MVQVLIFSQMTRMLDLLESYLSQSGHHPCRIDGSMPFEDRQQVRECQQGGRWQGGDLLRWLYLWFLAGGWWCWMRQQCSVMYGVQD
jgi:hypothetical protein